MPRKKLSEDEKLRVREYRVGMRQRADKCRLCDSDLKPYEREEGLCDSCLRAKQAVIV